MDQLQKKEVIQAVLIADNFNDNFLPITNETSLSLLPLVNTPLLDYSLEALNRSGVEEVFVFCSNFIDKIKEYIKDGISKKVSWSIQMSVQVVGSEGCRCLGDALRDLDAKGLIRGHFILLGCDTVTNAHLGTILEQHKQKCKFDKGAAMTVVYKKTAPGFCTGDEICVAYDKDSNRLLHHQRLQPLSKERNFEFLLELFLVNSEVVIRHDLIDPQIAICAPSALPLFADNFDFENRDDFVRGLLINEEILASTIYMFELPTEQYATKVSNWQTYQFISNDVINRWAYPLVPDMGICTLKQNYMFLRNNIYRSKDVQLARSGTLKENVVIQENCSVDDGTTLSFSVIGRNCKIGKNCILDHAYLFDDVTISDNCILKHCVIGKGARIGADTHITEGSVLGSQVELNDNSKVSKLFVQSTLPEDENSVELGPNAYTVPDSVDVYEPDSDDEDYVAPNGTVYMHELNKLDTTSSVYSSSNNDDESQCASPIPEDSNIFLSEVIDSLTRGFKEKTNPDFLILEINSSRYAYNMTLTEVNFFVVKAILSLPPIMVPDVNVLTAINQIFSHLGAVFKNYIRGDSAMRDCLKAIEECCQQNDNLKPKISQIIHYFYNKEILTDEAILSWHEDLDDDEESVVLMKKELKKLVDWLLESDDEDSDEEESD